MSETINDFTRAIDFLGDLESGQRKVYSDETAVWLIKKVKPTSKPILTIMSLLAEQVSPPSDQGIWSTSQSNDQCLSVDYVGPHALVHGRSWLLSCLYILPRGLAQERSTDRIMCVRYANIFGRVYTRGLYKNATDLVTRKTRTDLLKKPDLPLAVRVGRDGLSFVTTRVNKALQR